MVPTSEPLRREPVGQLLLIGRRENVHFAEWHLGRIRAKVDTGAYSSVLGVAGHEWLDSAAGPRVRFTVPVVGGRTIHVEAPVLKRVRVRCSSGRTEYRPLVETEVCLGTVRRRIRLTLTNRSRMRCRMLLGRQALAGHFVVDVRFKDLLRTTSPA